MAVTRQAGFSVAQVIRFASIPRFRAKEPLSIIEPAQLARRYPIRAIQHQGSCALHNGISIFLATLICKTGTP
jgi:hypothetical protein